MNKDIATFLDKNQSRMSCLLEAVETVTSDLKGTASQPKQSRYGVNHHPRASIPGTQDYPITKPMIVPAIRNYSSPDHYMTRDRYSLDRDYVSRFHDFAPRQYYKHENIVSPSSAPMNSSLHANPHFEMKKRKPKSKAPTFPELLMQVLSDSSCRSAVSWSADGKSFAILHKERFINDVLPCYFRQCQMASFQRKLNRWGFRVIHIFTDGRQDSAYHHELFQRNKPHLLKHMSCNSKGGASRSPDHSTIIKEDIKCSSEEINSDTDKMMPEISTTSERENLKRVRSHSDEGHFKRRRTTSDLGHKSSQLHGHYSRYPSRAQTDEHCTIPFEEMMSSQIRREHIARMPCSFFDDMLVSRTRSEMSMMKPIDVQDYEQLCRNSDLQLVEQEMMTSRRIASLSLKRGEYVYGERYSSHGDRTFPRVYMDEMRATKEIVPPSYGNQRFDQIRRIF